MNEQSELQKPCAPTVPPTNAVTLSPVLAYTLSSSTKMLSFPIGGYVGFIGLARLMILIYAGLRGSGAGKGKGNGNG